MEKSISKISNILKNKESKISFIFPSKKFINELKIILLNNGLIEDNINIIIEYLFDADFININIPKLINNYIFQIKKEYDDRSNNEYYQYYENNNIMINLIDNIDKLYNLIVYDNNLLPCSYCKNKYIIKKSWIEDYYTNYCKIDYEVINDETGEHCEYNCDKYKSEICKQLIEINNIYNYELSTNSFYYH